MSTMISRGAAVVGSLLLSTVFLAGCIMPPTEDEDAQGTGHVAFFVKDAPSDDFSSVFVTFSRVEIHRTGADDGSSPNASAPANSTVLTNSTSPANTTAPANSTVPANGTSPANTTVPANSTVPADATAPNKEKGSGAGWIVIVNSTHTIDLKAFQGDARAFLGGSDVAAGTYTQIRIFVDRAYGVANGTEVNLSLPSGTLKITRPWSVGSGENTTLVVDFELDKSIHRTGNGKYQLKPVLKLAVQHDEADEEAGDDHEADEPQASDAPGGGGPKSNNTHRPTDKGKPN